MTTTDFGPVYVGTETLSPASERYGENSTTGQE
jgi:hypothetical protein